MSFLGLFCNPFFSFGQDSIPGIEDLNEEKELKFQQFFFKALSEKSIKNYQKAIENLENCNEIFPENITVYFEFSKNYLLLNKPQEAKEYIDRALKKDPENIWMLSHLVEIHKKQRNFKDAISTQLKIVKTNSKKREDLARLYYLNRDYDKALSLMNALQEEVGLSRNLKRLKSSLEFRKEFVSEVNGNNLSSLVKNFEQDKTSFQSLKKLLDSAIINDKEAFHKYSKLSIDLFPAQPYAYLMYGKSLLMNKEFKKVIATVESGLDFVIDNTDLESQCYDLMGNAYEGLNNVEKATEMRNRAKKLRSIK